MTEELACATCGRTHSISDSELTFGLPDVVFALSTEERDARCEVGKEIVVLDGATFFLRGLLPLKVSGRAREYNVGVWVELSRSSLDRIDELWSDPDQNQEPRIPGKLANQIPFHLNTVGLSVAIQLTGPKTRPAFYIEQIDHSLYVEQSRGIDEHRAIEYSDPEARKAPIKK